MPAKQQTSGNGKASVRQRPKQSAQASPRQTNQTDAAYRVPRIGGSPGSLTRDDMLQLQRTVGNYAVEQLLSENETKSGGTQLQTDGAGRPAHRIQRVVMTDEQWITKSAKFGKSRSELLLQIDIALAEYNKAHSQPPRQRLALLGDLLATIDTWERSKQNRHGDVKSSRATAVYVLKRRATLERTELEELMDAGTAPESAGEVREAVKDLYKRGVHELHTFLSKKPTRKSLDEVTGYWQRFRTEAMRIERAASGLDTDRDDDAYNAHLAALALREAMRAFRTISYRHIGSSRPDTEKTDLNAIRARLNDLAGDFRDTGEEAAVDAAFVDRVREDIDLFAALVGADGRSEATLEAMRDEENVDFDLLEEMLNSIDISTTMLGYQGTAGVGNEGFSEFYKSAPSDGSEDTRTDGQKQVAEMFSGWVPESDQGKDIVSGVADMENAFAGLESDAISFLQAWKTYKDPNASEDERLQAKLQLIRTPFSTVSNALKFTGGALTAHRGGDSDKLADSLAFTADGTDVSTDVKMSGDFFGLFSGVINTIGKVIDLVKFVKSGGGQSAKAQKNTTRKDLEAVGNTLQKYTGTVASLAGNYKSAAKLGYQIAGGGQQAASDAAQVVNLGGVVPGVQLASSVLQTIQHAYKLVRLGIRRGTLTTKIDRLLAAGGDLKETEAVEFAHEALVKRMHRVGINLGHSLASIVAGGFNLSGIGLAPGMVINLASSALKIGQIGLRKAKQFGRDKKARKREKKGKTESYADWKRAKRLRAARKGKWQQFKTAISIKFTFNWDKSSENKESTTQQVALEVLRLNDTDVYDALGVTDELEIVDDFSERIKIVVAALKKRD